MKDGFAAWKRFFPVCPVSEQSIRNATKLQGNQKSLFQQLILFSRSFLKQNVVQLTNPHREVCGKKNMDDVLCTDAIKVEIFSYTFLGMQCISLFIGGKGSPWIKEHQLPVHIVKHGGGSIMVQSCFSASGTGGIECLEKSWPLN